MYISQRKGALLLTVCNHCLQLSSLLLALYIAYSRLADHRQHMVDVVTGSVIGTVLGMLAADTLVFMNTVWKKKNEHASR